MSGYKKFNTVLLSTVLCIITILGVFNFIVDPYNVFNSHLYKFNVLKPEAKRQERLTKIIGYKLNRQKIDTVFVGTSKVDWAFDKNYYRQKTEKNAENMAIVGLSYSEFLDLTKLCIILHPEVKNIYLGIDFNTFNSNHKDNQKHIGFNESKKLTTQELSTVLLSIDTTVSSFITISKNLSGSEDKMYNSAGNKHIFVNPAIDDHFRRSIVKYFHYYKTLKIKDENYEQLAELIKYCKSKGIKLHVFITPGHISDIDTIYDGGVWNEFENWKKNIVKVTEITDFYYPNSINNAVIKPNMTEFYDAAHATNLIGNKMIDAMVDGPKDYGRILNQRNVKSHLVKDKQDLLKWRSENKSFVEKVQSYKGQEE